MKRFIEKPNLPKGRVCEVICGTDDKRILDFFKENNISVLKNIANTDTDPSVSAHADMAALHLGENRVLIDKAQNMLKIELEHNGFIVFEAAGKVKGEYPEDVKLNFTVTDNFIIGNFSHIDKTLLREAGFKKAINVKQGYSKCSTLIIDEQSAVTDDVSIFKALQKNGFDVLLISKGDIYLQGHEYGFIGGSSGKISKNTVVFFGDITKHRDFEKIKAFLSEHGCDFVCSDCGELRDIGGIVALMEE